MSKSRMPLYLCAGGVGAVGYYLYRAGGDPKVAGDKIKIDAEKAREKLPGNESAEKFGKDVGKDAGSKVDEAIANARAKGEKIPEWAQEGKDKLDGLRDDAKSKFNAGRDKVNSGVDQADRTVEQKAADAKGTVSGWFGSKK
ncbi:hypothetical protein N7499_009681 [Penicillium canescens]|uniref:Calcofluor white hypersensitive protein n=1 Tax=Penicillium canescens TaxID=5083 RepID=A0AAD6NED7_PENCN|nr:uncharacterized protein N7446_008297 [Penicillium canescens]KAJ6019161.1 hypothetical protein N7522_001228 [Penicillium canescens]KAJ6033410.1 hypothetical protein N7444_011181 [Penicillium canescens]KAJ6057399.1 hypothetical protein N7460_000673 [Penicillium canescens]KAJ6058714.1 hypothetical protein N7446_008297 [Penicillium canescens]KAJ6071667.1 hypothetical protein N7499_009681 [Penicillium canescens]